MTGFGRSEMSADNKKITIEMKSVNHRYLDVNIKTPKKLSFYDTFLRNLLKKYIERGKVDIFVTYEDESDNGKVLSYDGALAMEYAKYIEQMGRELKIENDITTSALIKCQDIFVMKDSTIDEEQMEKLLTEVFEEAAKNFVNTRITEGENLKNDLIDKLNQMAEYVSFIEERSPQIIEEYKKKITEKINELLENQQIDENRIIMEVTLFADKICVDEEIVRLKSHIDGMKNTLLKGGAVGRKLDFVAQEMNREANTILSKSSDIEITDVGIELKTIIEKVREQIQNIE
ncbi:MAG: YicC family protein [Lachnospiraceae bacterium]|nr:YicC family protein [Lachnospiraceae bacterium]